MGASDAAQAEVSKRPYKNQTAGWVGVVKLNHLGAQEGDTVAPYGTTWLSDIEARLTARAPARAEDNPFVEQEMHFLDREGKQITQKVAPLVLVEDERDIPIDERFVPQVTVDTTAEAGALDTARALADETEREVPTEAKEPTLMPASAAAVPPSQSRPGYPPESTAPEPEESDRVRVEQGNLQGADVVDDEETAGTIEQTGEETGAADTPKGDPEQGEYAQAEEVATPDAASKPKGASGGSA